MYKKGVWKFIVIYNLYFCQTFHENERDKHSQQSAFNARSS